MIAPTEPGGPVRASQECVDLVSLKKSDDRRVESLLWDGEYPLDHPGVFGAAQGRVAIQRMDRGQAGVACGDRVRAIVLEMVKESSDGRDIEISQIEYCGLLGEPNLGIAQQQAERVPIRGD